MRTLRRSTPESIQKESRDKGAISTGNAILLAGAALVGLVIYNNLREDDPSPTSPTSTAVPTSPEASAPPVEGTASGTIGGQPVETSPPVVPPTSPVAGGEPIPAGPITIDYSFVNSQGRLVPFVCDGVPFVVQTEPHPASGEYSLWLGVSQNVFPGMDISGLTKQPKEAALKIAELSETIDSRLNIDTTALSLNGGDNLHANGNPNAPAVIAMGSSCDIDGVANAVPAYTPAG